MRVVAILLCLVVPIAAVVLKIEAHYPDASLNGRVMMIRGDQAPLSWEHDVSMTKEGTNLWSYTFSNAPASGRLEFKTRACQGSSCRWQVGANEAFVFSSASTVITSYPFYDTTSGTLQRVTGVASPQLGNVRNVDVYLPPSFHENTLKVYENVLFMHDGQNLFDPSTAFGGVAWMCQDAINMQINTGAMQEVIVFGPWNAGANRINEYTYSRDPGYGGGRGDLYLDFLSDTLYGAMASRYNNRVPPSFKEAQVGILGSSLGGLISCYAGWTRPHDYAKTGCMSSSFWWNSQDFRHVILQKPTPNPRTPIYLDSGDSGNSQDGLAETTNVYNRLLASGYVNGTTTMQYVDRGGTHTERSWGRRFHLPMAFLYPPTPLKAKTAANGTKPML